MRTVLVLAALACAVLAVCAPHDTECRWAQFKTDFKKVYASPAEEAHRFAVFKDKLAEIERFNAESTGAVYGVNKFSDLTHEEFRARYINTNPARLREAMKNLAHSAHRVEPVITKRSLPTNWQTPHMTAVEDQGQCGSCWAFSTMGAVEISHFAATGQNISLGPQQLVDCDDLTYYGQRVDNGCNGGLPEYGVQYVIKNGAMSMADYPYTSGNSGNAGTCQYNANKVVAHVSNYVSKPWDESTYDQFVYQYNAIAIGMDASASAFQTYTDGIYSCSGSTQTDHAVLLVGFGVYQGQQYWLVRNSWGTGWGLNGFFYLQRGTATCAITTMDGVAAISADSAAPTVSSSGATPAPPTPASSGSPCTPNYNACNNYQCGTVSDGCGGTIQCGSCSAPYSCSNNMCYCTPLQNPCGTQPGCGTVSDGCGGTVMCGSCPSGQTCFANGTCGTLVSTGTWSEFMPAGNTGDFSVSSSGSSVVITLNKAGSTEYRTSWTTSGNAAAATWVSFSATITATAPGTVGLGMRLGQSTGPTDGISWKVLIPASGKSTLQMCGMYYGSDQCNTVTTFTWPMNNANNFTVNFALQTDSSGNQAISMLPYLNGNCLTAVKSGNTITTTSQLFPVQYFPNSGTAFIVASGAGKTFAKPELITATYIQLKLAAPLQPAVATSRIVAMLGVPSSAVSFARGWCRGRCSSNTFDTINVMLQDSQGLPLLGVVDYYVGGGKVIPNQQFSADLAQRLINFQKTSAFMGTVLEGATFSVVPIDAAAAAGLSAGAIAGIAVGATVGAVLLAGTAGFFIYGATRPEPKEPIPADYRPRNPVRKTLYKIYASKKGVDVINPPTVVHASITARAVPQEVA